MGGVPRVCVCVGAKVCVWCVWGVQQAQGVELNILGSDPSQGKQVF